MSKTITEIQFPFTKPKTLNTLQAVFRSIDAKALDEILLTGNELTFRNKVKIHKLSDGNICDHVLISKNELSVSSILRGDSVCLYSKYYRPFNTPRICRYNVNYRKVYDWINGETTHNSCSYESIWERTYTAIVNNREYNGKLPRSCRLEELYFISDGGLMWDNSVAIDGSDIELFMGDIHNPYLTKIHPEVMLHRRNLVNYYMTFKNINKTTIRPSNSKYINSVDDLILNKLFLLPFRELASIYYPIEDRVEILHYNSPCPIGKSNDVEEILCSIGRQFKYKNLPPMMEIVNEQFIITEYNNRTLFLNLPMSDLCNNIFL